jgi:hypothetical protein
MKRPLPDLPSPRLAIVAASDYKKVDHVLAEFRSGAVVGGVEQAVGAELHMGNIRDRLAIQPGQCHFKEVGSQTLSK